MQGTPDGTRIKLHRLIPALEQQVMSSPQNFPPRTPWGSLPDVIIHASESAVIQHPCYAAAKSGDTEAAFSLVKETISEDAIKALSIVVGDRNPVLVSAHAFEKFGVNAIPETLSDMLGRHLGWVIDGAVVQTNVVEHTGANGYDRLARQASFNGLIAAGKNYVMVDDFIGQGGTLANLKGYIETHGGTVVGATVLTGKPFSAKLTLLNDQLDALRKKHGHELEKWWETQFGHGFDRLTQSEARYLERSPDADTIRNKVTEAKQAGNRRDQ